MLIFYIDESITPDEEFGVLSQLSAFGENVQGGLVHKRIPFVFPIDTAKVSNEDFIQLFQSHINNAGVKYGSNGVFVMPKMTRFGVLMQLAFKEIAGRSPYVIQPWQVTMTGEFERREYLVVSDMNSFMQS